MSDPIKPALFGESIAVKQPFVDSTVGVTLVAGGPVLRRDFALARRFAPRVVAADGGADRVLAFGVEPEAVIGDMDSISAEGSARLTGRLHPVAEQESTDFDKALRHIHAPFVLGLGCLGGRVDHELAVFSGLLQPEAPFCLLLGREDLVFAAPPRLDLALQAGDRVSLYPLTPVVGRSCGLRWPIEGLDFAPERRIGTSNAAEGPVRLEFEGRGMLVILPRARLAVVLRGMGLI